MEWKQIQELYEYGLIVDRVMIKEDKGKKKLYNRLKEKDVDYESILEKIKNKYKKTNGTIILTGNRKCPKNVFVLDIDRKDEGGIKNGYEKWEQLIEENGEIDTWTVKTGNGGLHYYFEMDNRLEKITIGTGLQIDGEKYSIDWRGNGGIIFCPPTKYTSEENAKEYEWIKSPNDTTLKAMPDWLYTIISEGMADFKPTLTVKQKMRPTRETVEELVSKLSTQRAENFDSWIKLGLCLHHLDKEYFDIWNDFSSKSDKYEGIEGCKQRWDQMKDNPDKKPLTFESLKRWVNEDNTHNAVQKAITLKPTKEEIISLQNLIEYYKCDCLAGLNLDIESYNKLQWAEKLIFNMQLLNAHCAVTNIVHSTNCTYIQVDEKGLCIKCRHADCCGDSYPRKKLPIPETCNIVFNINNLNINKQDDMSACSPDFTDEMSRLVLFDDEDEDEDKEKAFWKSLSGLHMDLETFIFEMFGNEYRCDSEDVWYQYKNHRWEKGIKASDNLRKAIKQEAMRYYEKLIKEIKNNKIDNDFGKKIKWINNVLKTLDKTLQNGQLPNSKFRHYYEDFEKSLDTKIYLVGFTNGVYDLNKQEFRPGVPEDYITMSVNYAFPKEKSDKYNDVIKFFEDIQPDEEQRNYLLTFLSTLLYGRNVEELFHIFTGKTRNGKSKLKDLIQATLGDYYTLQNVSFLTDDRPGPCAAQPDILGLIGIRCAIASEPKAKGKLNTSFIKTFSGEFALKARPLYGNKEIEFLLQCKVIMLCNDLLDMDKVDEAICKRIRCVNFPITFVENPTTEMEKKIDETLSEKIKTWGPDMMILLLEYWKNYKEKGLKVPKSVLYTTQEYQENSDIYLKYLKERTEPAETNIHTSTLYSDFVQWYKENNPSSSVPNNKIFIFGIGRYKVIEKNVKVNCKSTTGI
jgi:P4 family phage/plasmid primase-like protien